MNLKIQNMLSIKTRNKEINENEKKSYNFCLTKNIIVDFQLSIWKLTLKHKQRWLLWKYNLCITKNFKCANLSINGMIFLCEILFNIWYTCGWFLLMLCKQLVHMYVVMLGFIWISKYVKVVLTIYF